MASAFRADMLLARIRLRAPSARTICVASTRGEADDSRVARDLAQSIGALGVRTRLLDATPGGQSKSVEGGPELLEVLESELMDLDRARRAMSPGSGSYTVACAGGVLDVPAALVIAAAADAVLLVVRQGSTSRADLARARVEIEGVGGTVLGAVLLD